VILAFRQSRVKRAPARGDFSRLARALSIKYLGKLFVVHERVLRADCLVDMGAEPDSAAPITTWSIRTRTCSE